MGFYFNTKGVTDFSITLNHKFLMYHSIGDISTFNTLVSPFFNTEETILFLATKGTNFLCNTKLEISG